MVITMPKYKFEIQTLITVEVEGEDKEKARIKVVDNLSSGKYGDDLSNNGGAYVSDGVEVD